jgi:hypothetical protein
MFGPNLGFYTKILTEVRMQGGKRGREVPGPLKKVLGLLDFFSPGTTGPRDLQGI